VDGVKAFFEKRQSKSSSEEISNVLEEA
jgi:hypothetical protein